MAFVADNSVIVAWFVKSQATPYTWKKQTLLGIRNVGAGLTAKMSQIPREGNQRGERN